MASVNNMNTRNTSLYTLIALIVFSGVILAVKPQLVVAACSINNTLTGNLTISANCTIDANTVEGLDEWRGTDVQTTNNAVLTINNNATLTLAAGTTQTTSLTLGTIVLSGGGKITIANNNSRIMTNTPTWVGDRDYDRYMASATAFAATASARRRRGLMQSTTLDCNDSAFSGNNSCYGYGQGYYQAYYYGYGQGYYQAYYYGYGQGYYYGYGQGYYYGYGQGYYYGYGQSWYYGYGQSAYYCFLENTSILMADGSRKAIKDVHVGDKVQSYDTATGTFKSDSVVAQIVHPQVTGTYLTINGTLQVTANHPVFVNGKWQEVGNARVGDTLVNDAGQTVTISSITESASGTHDLYNLHLEGADHNYFAEGVLVHNK